MSSTQVAEDAPESAGPDEREGRRGEPRPEKVAVVDEVRDELSSNPATILTEYRGLSVGELAELRAALREAGADYVVVKNTLARIAARDAGFGDLVDFLTGPTALTYCSDDPVGPAKALRQFSKDHPELVIKGGILEGRVVDAETADKLADLESREDLLARLAQLMYGALANTASLLEAPLSKMARLFAAYQEEGDLPEGEAPPAAEEPEAEEPTEEPEAADEPEAEEPAEEPEAVEEPEAAEEPEEAPEPEPEPEDEPESEDEGVVGAVADTAAEAVETATDAAETAVETAAETAKDVAEDTPAESAVDVAAEVTEAAAEAATDTVDEAAETAAETAKDVAGEETGTSEATADEDRDDEDQQETEDDEEDRS